MKSFQKILFFLFFIVFLLSTSLLLRQFSHNAQGQDAYTDALTIAAGSLSAESLPAPTQPETGWIPAPIADDPVMEEMGANGDHPVLRCQPGQKFPQHTNLNRFHPIALFPLVLPSV